MPLVGFKKATLSILASSQQDLGFPQMLKPFLRICMSSCSLPGVINDNSLTQQIITRINLQSILYFSRPSFAYDCIKKPRYYITYYCAQFSVAMTTLVV